VEFVLINSTLKIDFEQQNIVICIYLYHQIPKKKSFHRTTNNRRKERRRKKGEKKKKIQLG
jgi:hypothetical protein